MIGPNVPATASVYISYNGLLDPLGASQIVPYVEIIARDRPMLVVSFEKGGVDERQARALAERLSARGITWTPLRYRRRPQLLAKTLDLWAGVRAVRGAIEGGAGIVHARGHVEMEIAVRSTRSLPILFDIRGLLPEEYVDARLWSARDPRYLWAKRAERGYYRRASGAVVLTKAIVPYVRARFAEFGRQPPLEVIPTVVDLERFRFDPSARAAARQNLDAEDRVVFVYSGSLGTWYLANEMARFVRVYRDTLGKSVLLLWQLNTAPDVARKASVDAGLAPGEVRITSARAEDVPAQLSAGDVALALVMPTFSKRASCPTKYAESLAVGMPLVMTRQVGDSAEFEAQGAGVTLEPPFDDSQMREACLRLETLRQLPRTHFTSLAERSFDIERVAMPAYRRLYQAILDTSDRPAA
jgi:glycosyltransferase involved in cell wall biosynthesis